MPPNTVYVGRPTDWGNPWRVGAKVADPIAGFFGDGHPSWFGRRAGDIIRDAADAMEMYRLWIHDCARRGAPFPIETLRGKNLACWCPLDQPCHADVLIEIANGPEDQDRPPADTASKGNERDGLSAKSKDRAWADQLAEKSPPSPRQIDWLKFPAGKRRIL